MTSKILKIIIDGCEIILNKRDTRGLDLASLRIVSGKKYKTFNYDQYVEVDGKLLHRIIMNPPKGLIVDHINHNGLDNRRSNLRLCTNSQNQMNRTKTRANTSGYKGVRYNKNTGKYQACITANKRNFYLGTFETAEEAVKAYRKAAKRLHGKFMYKDLP